MFWWLQRMLGAIFAAPSPSPNPLPRPKPKPSKPVGKLAIVIGHTSKSQGAKGIDMPAEWTFNKSQIPHITDAARKYNVEVKFFYRPADLGYAAGLRVAYTEADSWGADAVIELHYNASSSKSATGSEILMSFSSGSKSLAAHVHDAQLRAFGLKDRGLKLRTKGKGRGWKSLYSGKAPAVLVEPGFGSNPKDAASLKRNWPVFAEYMVEAFINWKKSK